MSQERAASRYEPALGRRPGLRPAASPDAAGPRNACLRHIRASHEHARMPPTPRAFPSFWQSVARASLPPPRPQLSSHGSHPVGGAIRGEGPGQRHRMPTTRASAQSGLNRPGGPDRSAHPGAIKAVTHPDRVGAYWGGSGARRMRSAYDGVPVGQLASRRSGGLDAAPGRCRRCRCVAADTGKSNGLRSRQRPGGRYH